MKFETFSSLLNSTEDRLITPFLSKRDNLFFIASAHEDLDAARSEVAAFEGITGLEALHDTMCRDEMEDWFEKLVQFNIAYGGERSVQ